MKIRTFEWRYPTPGEDIVYKYTLSQTGPRLRIAGIINLGVRWELRSDLPKRVHMSRNMQPENTVIKSGSAWTTNQAIQTAERYALRDINVISIAIPTC